MIKHKTKLVDFICYEQAEQEYETGGRHKLLMKYEVSKKQNDIPPQEELTGDAKVLYEAYKNFAKNGMTHDETVKLQKIDELLADASIQLTKDGGAVITNSDGKSVKIPNR